MYNIVILVPYDVEPLWSKIYTSFQYSVLDAPGANQSRVLWTDNQILCRFQQISTDSIHREISDRVAAPLQKGVCAMAERETESSYPGICLLVFRIGETAYNRFRYSVSFRYSAL